MGGDSGQPEPSSWPPPDDTNPDQRQRRSPGREWYPGTEWYPGKEYRPPRYGEPRAPEGPPGHYPPANGRSAQGRGRPVNGQGLDGQGTDGRGVNPRGANGRGVNGRGFNGRPVNGQGANGRGISGRGIDGRGVAGPGVNGHRVNGHRMNGHPPLRNDPPPGPDDYLEGWFRERPERRPRAGEYPAQGRQYPPRGREYPPRDRQDSPRYRRPQDMPPGAGGHSILGLNPPPGPRAARRHRVRNGMLVGLGFLIVIVGVGTGLCGGKLPSSGSRAATGSTAATAAAPKSGGTAGSAPGPTTLTYRVTGTAGVAVTYGPAGRTRTRQGPLHVTATLGRALYYSVTAELAGSGSVTCEILLGARVMSRSVATGGGHLASCEISQDPLSGRWRAATGG